MKFSERVDSLFKKGVAASRILAGKAGQKANNLGSMGVLKFETAQMKADEFSLDAKLGKEVYLALADMGHATVSRDTRSIHEVLEEITKLRGRIKVKEDAYRVIAAKNGAEALP